MIATSHGIVWRDNPAQIIEQYLEWADNYQEDRITIFYDSMSNNTRMMADAIAQGIHDVDPGVAVKVFNVSKHDKNEILANVFRSKGVFGRVLNHEQRHDAKNCRNARGNYRSSF